MRVSTAAALLGACALATHARATPLTSSPKIDTIVVGVPFGRGVASGARLPYSLVPTLTPYSLRAFCTAPRRPHRESRTSRRRGSHLWQPCRLRFDLVHLTFPLHVWGARPPQVVMMENRAFDHMLGYMARGGPFGDERVDGLNGTECNAKSLAAGGACTQTPFSSVCLGPNARAAAAAAGIVCANDKAADRCEYDPNHTHGATTERIFGCKYVRHRHSLPEARACARACVCMCVFWRRAGSIYSLGFAQSILFSGFTFERPSESVAAARTAQPPCPTRHRAVPTTNARSFCATARRRRYSSHDDANGTTPCTNHASVASSPTMTGFTQSAVQWRRARRLWPSARSLRHSGDVRTAVLTRVPGCSPRVLRAARLPRRAAPCGREPCEPTRNVRPPLGSHAPRGVLGVAHTNGNNGDRCGKAATARTRCRCGPARRCRSSRRSPKSLPTSTASSARTQARLPCNLATLLLLLAPSCRHVH